MRNSTIVGVLVVLIAVLGGWYWWSLNGGPAMPGVGRPGMQACTMEAMVCPDGSSVGRTGPNCSFAPCPAVPSKPASSSAAPAAPGQDAGIGDSSVPGGPGAAQSVVIGSNVALGTDSKAGVGTYLISYNGMPLYTYANDTTTASTCNGTCAQTWPPYVVGTDDDVTQVKAGVNGKVGTTKRTNGTIQMTYNGKPLYYYAEDTSASGPTGNGKASVWYTAKP